MKYIFKSFIFRFCSLVRGLYMRAWQGDSALVNYLVEDKSITEGVSGRHLGDLLLSQPSVGITLT